VRSTWSRVFLEAFRQRFGRSTCTSSASELMVCVCGGREMVDFDRFADQTSGIRCQQAPRELRSSAICRLLLNLTEGSLHFACFCQCIGHAPKPWPSFEWLSFQEMHGWSRQHHPKPRRPTPTSHLPFLFSVSRPYTSDSGCCLLNCMHDPRPATVVRTASKIAPNLTTV
jgi:hypothetical protein